MIGPCLDAKDRPICPDCGSPLHESGQGEEVRRMACVRGCLIFAWYPDGYEVTRPMVMGGW